MLLFKTYLLKLCHEFQCCDMDYNLAEKAARALKVVNDTTEGGIALIQNTSIEVVS